jgi:hypothetical protein
MTKTCLSTPESHRNQKSRPWSVKIFIPYTLVLIPQYMLAAVSTFVVEFYIIMIMRYIKTIDLRSVVKIAAAHILWHQVRARKFFSSQTYACHKLERRWQFLYIYMTQLQPIKKSFHLVSGANKFLAHTRNTWAEILVDVSVNVGIEVVKAFGVQKLQMFCLQYSFNAQIYSLF